MSKRRFTPLFLILIFGLLLSACQSGGAGSGSDPAAPDQSKSGPAEGLAGPFRAEATSAISVNLTWDPVEGATGYRLENQFGDSEWFILAELGADVIAYEDFLAPSNMDLNYRLTPLMNEAEGKVLTTTVSTPEVVPNPYRVVAKLEEPDYSDIGLDLPGFDPSTFDPSTFDPSTLDFSSLDTENLDITTLGPEPVSAIGRIGPEGGSLSVTGRNGVIYTLEVPPEGLDYPVLFLLTPVAEIEGYPFSNGWKAAVDIQPAGLYFDIPATVTFQIPVVETSEVQGDPEIVNVGFAFDQGGGEFHLVPFEDEGISEAWLPGPAGKLAMPARTLFQVSQATVRRATSAGTGPASRSEGNKVTSENPPTKPSDQADSKTAAEDLNKNPDRARAERAAEALRQRLGQGGVQQFTDTLLADFAAFYASPLYKMLSEKTQEKLWSTAVANMVYHLQNTENPCPSPEAAALQDLVYRLLKPKTSFEKELARRYLSENTTQRRNILEAHAAARSCNVELIINSTASIADEQCKAVLTIHAEVPLRWRFDGEPFLTGVDQLKYEELKVEQGYKPGKAVCKEYSFNNLDRSAIVVNFLHPIFSGNRHTDWTMIKQGTGGLSGVGEVRQVTRAYLQTDDDPPTYHNNIGTSTQGGYSDPWGGIISLVGTQTNVWPGSSKWKLQSDPDNRIIAEWDLGRWANASGQGWKAEHRTVLALVTTK